MKRYQKGDVTLLVIVMIGMMAWMVSGHMGMMGHGNGHTEKSGQTEQQTKAEPSQPSAPKESPEHQH